MYCTKCGALMEDDNAVFCPYCGAKLIVTNKSEERDHEEFEQSYQQPRDSQCGGQYDSSRQQQYGQRQQYDPRYNSQDSYGQYDYRNQPADNPGDTGAAGFGVLGFFIPIVGLILYLIWSKEYPKRAKAAGTGALVNVVCGVAAVVLTFIIILCITLAVEPWLYYPVDYAITSLIA